MPGVLKNFVRILYNTVKVWNYFFTNYRQEYLYIKLLFPTKISINPLSSVNIA